VTGRSSSRARTSASLSLYPGRGLGRGYADRAIDIGTQDSLRPALWTYPLPRPLPAYRERESAVCLLVVLVMLVGCEVRERIPTYPLMPAAQTFEQLRTRSAGVQTVSGEGSLRMTRPDGQSIGLDAAVVLRPPEQARVRAWKFGRAVFDLTASPEGVYVVAPKESSQREQILSAGSRAATMIRDWLKLTTGAFDANELQERGNELVATRAEADGGRLVCVIDRRTITARSFKLVDANGRERFSLKLDRYAESNGRVWPRRIEAKSEEGGELRFELREVEINGELPAGAFRPPPRAQRLP
jgi:hypothetical protein